MMERVHFISFANNHFASRKSVLESSCLESGWFDTWCVLSDDDLSNSFKEKYNDILRCIYGSGYWLWKSEIIRQLLKSTNEGDIIIYADAGCTLNLTEQSRPNFDKYIDICKNHSLLRFELELPEWHWTNKRTIEFFRDNYNLKKEHVLSNQLVGGIICMQNNSIVETFFDTFFEIIDRDHNLITNKYNQIEPLNGFKDHRYDQSILSLLSKSSGIGYILPDETWPNNPNFPSWNESDKFPFLATRKR
jgi:hypothetical protein